MNPVPWQATFQKVYKRKPDGFEVVSPRLVQAIVSREACKFSGAAESNALLLLDVVSSTSFLIVLYQAKIDEHDLVFTKIDKFLLFDTYIAWLNISVYNTLRMNLLNTFDHLYS